MKNATHVKLIMANGKNSNMTVKAFGALSAKDKNEIGHVKVEWLKTQNKAGKFTSLGVENVQPIAPAIIETSAPVVAPVIPANGNAESDIATQKLDATRAQASAGNPIASSALVASNTSAFVDNEDVLTCMKNAHAWNANEKNTVEKIGFRDNNNVLNRFEYVPQRMQVAGKDTRFSMLTCSDNGLPVGKPFADSYGLVTNNDFVSMAEQIASVLDTLGLKYEITTTGTLQNRERQFLSIRILNEDKMTIDGREFQAFLNCLNSIPSNAGCTVTFANNTFCVCCRNTFAHVLHNEDGAKFHAAIKHSRNVKIALGDIPLLVENYFTGNAKLFAQLKAFSVFPVTLDMAEEYFAAFLGRNDKVGTKAIIGKMDVTDKTALSTRSANMVAVLQSLFVNGKGNKGETALDLFQAVTEYYTHFSAGETDDAMKQWNSSEVGTGYENKNVFYTWLAKHIQSTATFNGIAKVGNTLLVAYRKTDKTLGTVAK